MNLLDFWDSVIESTLTFVSSTIGHLAWPIVVGTAVLIFRKPIVALIARVRSVKGVGVDVEIREELREADSSARKAEWLAFAEQQEKPAPAPSSESHPPQVKPGSKAMHRLNAFNDALENDVAAGDLAAADNIPNAFDRMYFMWGRLEKSLSRLYGYAVKGEKSEILPVDVLAEILANGEILDREFVDSVAALRAVLEEVSATGYASHTTARKFTRTAARLRAIVERQNALYALGD